MKISTGLIILGVGMIARGGFIFVLALLIVFHLEPAIAAGCGISIVIINSLSGVAGYTKKKMIHYRAVSMGAFPGSLTGVWLLPLFVESSFSN